MALEPVTYTEDDAVFTVPAGVAATLEGSYDTITLSAGDTLVATAYSGNDGIDSATSGLAIEAGAGTDLTIAAPAAVITVDQAGVADILHGGTVSIGPAATGLGPASVTVSNDDLTVLTTITGSAPATITVAAGAAVDINDPAASISISGSDGVLAISGFTGAASYALRANPDNISGLVDTIVGTTQANLQGAFAGEIADFSDGTSELLLPGTGAYGIYAEDEYFSSLDAHGFETSSILDIYNGKTETSILQVYHPLNGGSEIVGGYALFSGPDETGTETANFNFSNGTSGHFAPFPSGAFGCFQVAAYYAGANETGLNYSTSYDFVNGTSQSSFVANGDYGCYEAKVHTDGLNANGAITQVILDFVGGVSRTITPISSGQETDVYTSGPDGTGRVLSSMTDPAGTAEATLNALTGGGFTNPTAFEPTLDLPNLLAHANVTHADFAATKGSAASLVSPADLPSRLSMPVAAPFAGMADTASPAIVPAILQHTR